MIYTILMYDKQTPRGRPSPPPALPGIVVGGTNPPFPEPIFGRPTLRRALCARSGANPITYSELPHLHYVAQSYSMCPSFLHQLLEAQSIVLDQSQRTSMIA